MLVVETYDGNDINDGSDYRAGFTPAALWGLPDSSVNTASREGNFPVFTKVSRNAYRINLFISIEDQTNVRALRDQLLYWFDPDDETLKELVITDDGSTNPRYVDCICESLKPFDVGGIAARDGFRVVLLVSGDAKWRSTSDETDNWSITASGQTNVVANDGSADAYPVYKITPTTVKSGGFTHRRFVVCKWKSENSTWRYPIRIVMNTFAEISGGDMQADGDDLQVMASGYRLDRYIYAINTASTYIWVNLPFSRAPTLELKTAIASSGSIDSIEFTDEVEVSLLPEQGIIIIDSEIFTYTGRSLLDAAVTGITRGAKFTSLAAHSVGTACYWLQHDLWVVYGNPSYTNPGDSPYNEPVFEISNSSNDGWVWADFGDYTWFRPGRWTMDGLLTVEALAGCYNANQRTLEGTLTNEFGYIGSYREGGGQWSVGWYFEGVCGVVNATWANGSKRSRVAGDWRAFVAYYTRESNSWIAQYHIPEPTAIDTWESWSYGPSGSDWNPADLIGLWVQGVDGDVQTAGSVTINFNTDETPDVTLDPEASSYELDCVITNNTTGESISVNCNMSLNEALIIDTYNKIIYFEDDNENVFGALTIAEGRRDWLKLQPGNNTIQFDDTGTAAVTFVTQFRERYY